MKKSLAALVITLAFASISQATELCGLLGSHAVGPQCRVGQPCPHWVKLIYTINVSAGKQIVVQAANESILRDFSELDGQNVCVEGQREADGFTVTSIEAQ